jgi:hypothetical protein
MKKKSSSSSAFFNLRLLIALLVGTTGVSLALFAANPFGHGATSSISKAQQKYSPFTGAVDYAALPPGFDCSKIHELGIDKMENMRAGRIMIACGAAEGGSSPNVSAFSRFLQRLLAPLSYGAADVDLITGTETFPNITQSETYSTANPDNPLQVCVAYNDSRGRNASPINISGISCSTDGGVTFTRVTGANGQSPFAGTEGDPVLLYNKPTGTWFTIWIDTACGGGGMGGYKSTNPSDPNSWTHYCVHSGSSDDRESGVADNNPASPFFGRMYMSWNNFNISGPPISVVRSTDNGVTWGGQVNLPVPSGAVFVRDVQITVDKVNGDVYVAGMDENGGNGCTSGCGTNRRNVIYRSTDGGTTFTNTYTGPAFVGACRASSGYFCTMYSSPAYWRHMSWGEPAAYNHVVSYVYAAKTGSDPGDVFYIRSTDSGATFSAPFQLNANTDPTKAQWQPNLSVSDGGTLLATWYDEAPRVAASCQPSSPSTPCYQMHARKSIDNGVTWLADDTLSDVVSPLPLQPDPGIVSVYVGDYDYASAILSKNVTSWADGRVIINGASQQDAFTDRELTASPTASPTPTPSATASPTPSATFTPTPTVIPCSNYFTTTTTGNTITAGTTDSGNHCDDCSTSINFPFPVYFYGTPYTTANVSSNGSLDLTGTQAPFTHGCQVLPSSNWSAAVLPYQDDLRTDNLGWTGCNVFPSATCGIFTSTTGTAPNRRFNIEWRATHFADTTTSANFEVVFYENQQSFFDVVYGATNDNGSDETSGVQASSSGPATTFSCGTSTLTSGLKVRYSCLGVPTPTVTPTTTASPTPTIFGTATPTPTCTASWSAGPNMPTVLVRAVGVYFPDGNFYTMGGRTADTAGSDFQHVLRYSPGTNSWNQMTVTLPDNQMNNMACGVLTLGGTPYIYCVGGSAAGQTTAAARVFYYNPVTDTVVTLTAGDNWPGDAAGTILPGGFAETGNKMYILGGFNINVSSTNQIWQFDPTAAVGSKWTQMTNTPVGIMYAPTAAIGGIIYVGGASDYSGGTVIDTTNSFSFNPTTNTTAAIAPIPRATGETRGLNFCNKMYVMGGGRVTPNPSTEVDVYDPASNTWSLGIPFMTPRRNFPTDTDGTNNIWLSGGYASDGVTPLDSMEIFHCPMSPCGGGSPTPTATATATAPSATPTATATSTSTPVASATPTATATATPTPVASPSPRATPTARPRPTPRQRP